MFGFSLPKILMLILILVIILYAFKLLEKLSNNKNNAHSFDDTKDLQLCKKCGSYCELDTHICKQNN